MKEKNSIIYGHTCAINNDHPERRQIKLVAEATKQTRRVAGVTYAPFCKSYKEGKVPIASGLLGIQSKYIHPHGFVNPRRRSPY